MKAEDKICENPDFKNEYLKKKNGPIICLFMFYNRYMLFICDITCARERRYQRFF